MAINIRKNHELRLKVFDLLNKIKNNNNITRKEIIERMHAEFNISKEVLYDWYSERYSPFGRRGRVIIKPELFYVLGALLGDGCIYNWRTTNNYVILVGDKKFTTKYAAMVTKCIGRKTKSYINRSKNIWFVRSNNFELYSLFNKIREDLNYLEELISKSNRKSVLFFIEGFFDAEGCIKVVKGEERKTPKICLDITNTNYKILELIKKLLKEQLNIDSRYSIQRKFLGKDGFVRQKIYHLRIYKKEYVKNFFENISTIKLKKEKVVYVENWLRNNK